jgi:lysophospholipase L1-like esterase
MAIAYPVGATLQPWDRSKDLFISWDGDSFGQAEGYSWSSAPDTGGLGFYFEAMLDLGLSQFDYVGVVGGTGYSQEGPASPPAFPRPKYSGAQRVAAVAAGPAPSIFLCGLGHNDNAIDRVQFAADTRAYWATLRAAWPTSVLVAAQYYFPAAGPAAPQAFEPNPLSTPNDPAILAALRAAGGPWVFVNTNQGTWQNSSGATGSIGPVGQPLLTGTGYGGAPGYAGGHTTGVGNGDTMIRDDGIHPSNLGAQFLGSRTAAAIIAGVLAL